MAFDWTSVWLATAGSLLLGVGFGYAMARRVLVPGWAIVVPMVALLILPVVILTGLRWREGLLPAGVLAGLPFVTLFAGTRFRAADETYGNVARSFGASEWRIFWRLLVPQAWRPIAAAVAIAWARIAVERAIVSRL